ncbi:zinc finger protein 184-like [Copidosoma floridanum]|uniref:zinc finger protein 184-like n=1 Tax=Copidosoma floridanum TaxID=29053 RepID=UPI0006C98429|nr:zinc finger protein 184-like [Copidosoma floridanum]
MLPFAPTCFEGSSDEGGEDSRPQSVFVKEDEYDSFDNELDVYKVTADDPLDLNNGGEDERSATFANGPKTPASAPPVRPKRKRKGYPNHLLTYYGRQKCRKCGHILKKAETLHQHQSTACKLERRFFCAHCTFKTKDRKFLSQHLARDCRPANHKPHQCRKCNQLCDTPGELFQHRRSCKMETRLFCPDCAFGTKSRENLAIHEERVHGEPGIYPCPRCDKLYRWRYLLMKHLETCYPLRPVSPIKPGQMLVCCLRCDTAENYMVCQPGERRTADCRACGSKLWYRCSTCAKEYQSVRTMRTHVRFQCQKLPSFQCAHCDFKTYLKPNLEVHLRARHSQTEVKEHKCPNCPKFYKFRTHMLHHYKYCGHGLDYHCDRESCDFRTKRPDYLTRHVLHNHGTKESKPPTEAFNGGSSLVMVLPGK